MVKEGYADHTQFDPESKYYDPKSLEEMPRWIMVDIQFKQKFAQTLFLKDIMCIPEIKDIGLIKRGHRLYIMPVKQNEFEWLLSDVNYLGRSHCLIKYHTTYKWLPHLK